MNNNNKKADFSKHVWVLMLGAGLVSCSDTTMEPSSESFSTAAAPMLMPMLNPSGSNVRSNCAANPGGQ